MRKISLKVTHWQSPYMHAYFPALNSYPSMLGDMLADGINCLGFTWVKFHQNSPEHIRGPDQENKEVCPHAFPESLFENMK